MKKSIKYIILGGILCASGVTAVHVVISIVCNVLKLILSIA